MPQFTDGSAITRDADTETSGAYRPRVTAVAGDNLVLLQRLAILQQYWLAEGGDGYEPDETDTDLVAGNALQ